MQVFEKIRNKFKYKSLIVLAFAFILVFTYLTFFADSYSNTTTANAWDGTISSSFSGGNGSPINPYLVANGSDLAYLKTLLEGDQASLYSDKNYKLINDINMGSYVFSIANNVAFSGVIDGDAHIVYNIKISNSLFNVMENAVVKNINFNDSVLIGDFSNDLAFLTNSCYSCDVENVVLSVAIDISNANNVGLLIANDYQGNLKNIYTNYEVINGNGANIASLIYEADGTRLENILIGDATNYVAIANNLVETNIYSYTVDNNVVNINGENALAIVDGFIESDDYTFRTSNGELLFIRKNSLFTMQTLSFQSSNSGIVGDTVYVNSLESDWDYYQGLNFVESSNGLLPTGINQNIYTESNLVRVQISYSGVEVNNSSTYIGTVSLTENQSKYVYYKYFPVENGKIKIELIDNPFTNRPTDKGFNNWISSGVGTISFDSVLYKRYIEVDVTYTNGLPDDVVLSLHASWVEAASAAKTNSTATTATTVGTWANAFGALNNKGMRALSLVSLNCTNMNGYYLYNLAARNATYSSNATPAYDEYGTRIANNTRCNLTGGCVYYTRITTNTNYVNGTNYYQLTGGMMRLVNDPAIGCFSVVAPDYVNKSMAGYFVQRTVARYASIVGLYDANGVYQSSGTCNTASGCVYYELLQSYDSNGVAPIMNASTTYYYMVTRDTNIIYLTGSLNSSGGGAGHIWASSLNKPFTFTSLHNGIKYNVTWTIGTYVNIYNDTTIENMTISTGTTPTSYSLASPPVATSNTIARHLYGNYRNLKVGRGIGRVGNNFNFISVIGGNTSATGSTSAPTKYNLMIESGYYYLTVGTNPYQSSTTNAYVNMNANYGNDYDKVSGNNSNLEIYFFATGSYGGNIRHSSNTRDVTSGLNTVIKSGSFGTSKYDHSTGLYVGGRGGGTHYITKSAWIEGGYIYNIVGGPLTDTSRGSTSNTPVNDVFIYIRGGTVDMVTGGAGTTATHGNRIISHTGGTITYSIFGGSNGYNAGSGDGTVKASSFLYVGGHSQVGVANLVTNGSKLFGAEAGSVFGIGNGNATANSIGSSDNSSIVIDGNARILNSVYGGGNFGATGISSGASTTTTNIKMLNGTVERSIYGGGNQNGSGATNKLSTINIDMYEGQVGSIYGGSNISGIIHGVTNVNVYGGTIVNNVYGGGQGNNTFVSRNVNVKIGNQNGGPTVNGSVYGGSAFGVVNATVNNTNFSTYPTSVIVENGVIVNSVYGGGQGNSSYTPSVAGNITVNINGGSMGYVYGGSDQAGVPNGTVIVNLNAGVIGEAYGGGNRSTVRGTDIRLNGATTSYLFGGSNTLGAVTRTDVTITSGQVNYVFGGNNVGGSVTTANVIVNGGKIINELYGGGNMVYTRTTNVTLNNVDVQIPYVFGGGKSAEVVTTNVSNNGIAVDNLFGGSNTSGIVHGSNITLINGTVNNIFGGNNAGGETLDAKVNINNGTINNVYGGGNKAQTNISETIINNGIINSVYGGGNEAGINNSKIVLNGATIQNVYGGSNASGTVVNTNISVQNSNVQIDNLYGGNNAGGQTQNPSILVSNGTIGNVYGGGNLAATTKTSVEVQGGIINTLYGGGNAASVAQNTILHISGGNIINNIYGGGNYGIVGGNTSVVLIGATIGGSAYAGGNGATASVYGNTNMNVGGTSVVGSDTSIAPISGSIFGGGNAATTGISSSNNSVSTVNIVGGTIYGNVYGGANTSVVYGTADVNIGKNTVTNSSIPVGVVYIKGTIFGGGEANASGSENYDYSFISVTNGIDVRIDGLGHSDFSMHGSIFGSGNASSTSGTSRITINNYGTLASPQQNISIQRTNILTIDNSYIVLSGATDRTNEYSDVLFTLSIVNNLKLQNNSTLYLETGTNVLRRLESLASNGAYEVVSIDDLTKTVTQNVDNRIYTLEGKNINIATNESVTSYGEVYGMTFFGMFTFDRDRNVNAGIYSPSFSYGDALNYGDMPSKGSYVLGLHKVNHNTQVDGFYSNFMDESSGTNVVKYIVPTPEDSDFYMWIIGEAIIEYNIDLIASKYATLGTAELTFLEFSKPNTSFQIVGFDDAELASGVSLIDGDMIPRVADTSNIANNVMGLSVKSGATGWLTRGETKFLTSNPNISGTTNYVGENSTSVPSLMFYLYHSKNLSDTADLGTVQITVMAITKVDALNSTTERLIINVNLSTALYQTNEYEGAMTPGREYSMFATSVVDITSKSSLSAYYSLFAENENLYRVGYHRSLVSTYLLPIGTKLTMIDFVNEVPTYYYLVITPTLYTASLSEYSLYGEVSYDFSLFAKMGSVNGLTYYDDALMNQIYYTNATDISSEEFIFIVDFEDTNITSNALDKSLLIELRDSGNHTLISVLGHQHQNLHYDLYANNDTEIGVDGAIDPTSVYIGQSVQLDLNTSFKNARVGAITIHDTRYFDSKMGIKITLLDSDGEQVSGTSLMGVKFIMDSVSYYPDIDGSTRIKIADRVGNASVWLTMNTENANIATGNYTIHVEVFGSPDGIYYGNTSTGVLEIPIEIINSIYGLDAKMDEKSTIIDAETGINKNGDNYMKFTIDYNSGLDNPNIRMQLLRRKYDTIYNTGYEVVDLADYVNQSLFPTANANEYLVISTPNPTNVLGLSMKENLLSGTYRLDFILYDNNVAIGRVSRYIIIK